MVGSPRLTRPVLAACAVLALAAAVAVVGAPEVPAGSSSAAARPQRAPAAARGVGVGLAHCTFVDTSRTTFDYHTGATHPGRVLRTEVRYPSVAAANTAGEVPGAGPETRRGALPTIFFAPGYDVTPDAYAALLDAWARAGFAVVAPSFPDTRPAAVSAARVGGSPEDDIVNQPADLAFLVRAALAASRTLDPACRVLHGLIDPAAVGLAGQSDGGSTVAMLAYDRSPEYAGLQVGVPVRAAAVLSGSEEPGTGPYEATAGDPALLVVQSATDRCNPPQESVELYDAVVQQDRWFLAIRRANHLPPYDGKNAAAFAAVARVTTRFFLLELHHEVPAAGFVAYGNASTAVATITTGPAAPALPALEFKIAACYAD